MTRSQLVGRSVERAGLEAAVVEAGDGDDLGIVAGGVDLFGGPEILDRQPSAITLRYLATLTDIAADHNSTIVFPLPLELMRMIGRPGGGPEPA